MKEEIQKLIDYSLLDNIYRQNSKSEKVELLFQYIRDKGKSNYDEMVTQYEHAVQTAYWASEQKADNQLIVSALLHDIGHLLIDEDNSNNSFLDEDLYHESLAADYFKELFSKAILDPIRLHVPSKRYICTIQREYYDTLSEASKKSFHVQGGFMSDEEVKLFESEPYYKQAVQLRICDDLGKQIGFEVPGIEVYKEKVVEALLG